MRLLLFLAVVSTSVFTGLGCRCPAGYQPMGEGKCVQRIDVSPFDYATAQLICHDYDGFLPSVTNAKENAALLAAANGSNVIIGLDEYCKWDDGRPYSFNNYEGGKTCANSGVTMMDLANGKWVIKDSMDTNTFLCTAECNSGCGCPAGLEEKVDGLCVGRFHESVFNANEARAVCQKNGVFLPSVTSVEENAAVFAESDGNNIFLGLTKGCKWDDGRDFTYSNYKSNKTCKNNDGPTMMWLDDGHWFISEMYATDMVVCTAQCKYASTPTAPTLPTSSASPSLSTCGTTPVQPNLSGERIVGGQTAVPYSWPWQIVWCSSGWFGGCSLECGGTVIDNGWVMTAAHCVYDDMNPKNYQVKAAIYKEDSTSESGEQISKVKAIHLNPDYDPRSHTYDISLIELATPLKYTDHVQAVCLPSVDTAAIAKPNSAYVTGWGRTVEQGEISVQLRQVKVPFVDYPTCEKEYPGEIVEKTMLCAGAEGFDSCQGDSGGPMVVQGNSGRWFQVGIVSWGKGCAEKGEAGVYGRVTAFCDFISATTSGKVSCLPIA